LNSLTDVDQTVAVVKRAYGNRFDISTWKTNDAGLVALLDVLDVGMAVLAGIIVIVAAIGMVNTFLLSVLERMPDFGTLRAIGLMPRQLIRLVVLQGVTLGVLGTVIGMAAAIPVVCYFQAHPIDYGEAMNTMKGVDSLIGLSFQPATALWISALGVGISLIACLYPAIHASRVRPVAILRNLA
jgi:ABC-type lipoprotein release transport system permease subunit